MGIRMSHIDEISPFAMEHPARKVWIKRLEIAYGLAFAPERRSQRNNWSPLFQILPSLYI